MNIYYPIISGLYTRIISQIKTLLIFGCNSTVVAWIWTVVEFFTLKKIRTRHQWWRDSRKWLHSSHVFGYSYSTRVTLRKLVTWLISSHVFHRMTRLESQSMSRDLSQSHFHKIFVLLMGKASSFAHKEISIFCFSDVQDWCKFSALTV